MTVRPLTEDDVDAAREVQTRSFRQLDRSLGEPEWTVTDEAVERQRARLLHFRAHDPGGSWVAVDGDTVVGVALALRRGGLWGLSLLAVDPDHQSRGLGRALLEASLTYAEGCASAIILSSRDTRAIRRYAAAGFDLFPQVSARGPVDTGRLAPPARRVRPCTDTDLADAVDVVVRGAPRGPDHAMLARHARMYAVDEPAGRGYAYLRPDGRVVTLAATDDTTAAALLTHCLRTDDVDADERVVEHITGEQQWAVRVAVAAGLRIAPDGPVFWRGRTPPPSYLPDGAYL